MEFVWFRDAMQRQFKTMLNSSDDLFRVDISGDELWEKYLSSFPEGSDPMFRERTQHDCGSCRHFVKQYGGIVVIVDNKIVSLWAMEIDGHYKIVADAMSAMIKSRVVDGIFLSPFKKLGIDKNHATEDGVVVTYNHFFLKLPNKFVITDGLIGSKRGRSADNANVLQRSIVEITPDAVSTVLDLIDQNSLYKGAEFRRTVQTLKDLQVKYFALPEDERDNFCWVTSAKMGDASKIRNSAIGSLLVDVSKDMDLDGAVRSYEAKVAPENYKRPNAIITKKMIDEAKGKIASLGFSQSLGRRYAELEDITVNNVLFANRDAQRAMSLDVFDELEASIPENVKQMDRVEEIPIETFIKKILPATTSLELMPEGRHAANLVSIIAPEDADAPSMFKWDNAFSWAYAGGVADSIKARVKKAGGNVEGILRCSLGWYNYDDLDIHVVEPSGHHIFFNSKCSVLTTGQLDVDMNAGGKSSRSAVENITWTDENRMEEGVYKLYIHQYNKRESVDFGFEVEIEYNGEIRTFSYSKPMRTGEEVLVAKFKWSARDGIEFLKTLDGGTSRSKEMWGISTNKFNPVSVFMLSPNHWDGHGVGNKHYFFILKDCKNPDPARGFFNEFLNEKLTPHKRVFEALGSKMMAQPVEGQLSGLGFSSTKRNTILCKVHGTFERAVKVVF